MGQWCDMHSTQDPHERHASQEIRLNEAAASIAKIVNDEAEIGGSDHRSIFQGCATAPYFAADELESECRALQTAVLLCHTRDEEVMGILYGRELRDKLMKLGYRVEWHEYEQGGHWLNELGDNVVAFIIRQHASATAAEEVHVM
ncbi:hypothetical protein LTR87_007217 [Friedmanniomyces endolithicus]|nr:hypothetical protein LTR87_007217 [Friedmanniomyces endolithicus]